MSSNNNYKHDIDDLISSFYFSYFRRRIKTLETHQDIGGGTYIYKKYGDVYAFENNQEKYETVKKNFLDYKYMNIENSINVKDTEENYVHIFSKPIDCMDGMRFLIDKNIHFDIIDVDPYGEPKKFFPLVHNFLSNFSFLFITSGEMHSPYRFNPQGTISQYELKGDTRIKSVRRFFLQQNGSIIGAKLIQESLSDNIGLFPIFFHDYFTSGEGVHRLGFIIKRPTDYRDTLILQRFLLKDPSLDVTVINYTNNITDLSRPWKFGFEISLEEVKQGIIARIEDFLMKNVKFRIK